MIYIVMVNDRHNDPEPWPYTEAGRALLAAEAEAMRLAGGDWSKVEVASPPADGWAWSAVIGSEGDSVWVVAKEMDA
jgi:hypothetical protein